jgi:hypothetical protein
MTREELNKRLIKVKGRSIQAKAIPMDSGRRGKNHIETTSEYEGEEFDDFFDFEEDLVNMESSRRQVERMEMEKVKAIENQPQIEIIEEDYEVEEEVEPSYFIIDLLDEKHERSGDDNSFFIFDEPLEEEVKEEVKEDLNKKYDDVVGFSFEYCAFIKQDETQCKRQAPKNGKYCGTHRKYIEKHSE